MSRYEALRSIGCGRFAAAAIAALNWLAGHPAGVIHFMHATIYYTPPENGHDQ